MNLIRRYGPPLIGVVLLVSVGIVLHRELRETPTGQILDYARGLPLLTIAASLALSAVSYVVLTAYDVLALRYVGRHLPYPRIAMASFVGYVVNHNLGPVFLGGSAVRYRLYSSWGLTPVEIGQVIAFTGLTFWLGFLTLAGAILVGEPRDVHALVGLDPGLTRLLGLAGPALVGAYLVRCTARGKPVRLKGLEVSLPSPRVGLAQIVVSSLDWLVASSVLWILLPDAPALTYGVFFGSFLLAQVVGVASTVPAGLGVFEATLLLALAPFAPKPDLLGAVLVFRAVYYVVPLVVASLLLGGHELLQRRSHAARLGRAVSSWASEVVPYAFALLAVVCGALLLIGAVTPTTAEKLHWLSRVLPVAALDASTFLASMTGMVLILVGSGLQRRLRAAWTLTVGLLVAGAGFTLLHSWDLETTSVLVAALLALAPCRGQFDRRSALLDEALSPRWAPGAVLVLIGATWLLRFSYRHVAYHPDLWWEFELGSQASRGLRALAGAAVVLVGYGLARLVHRRRGGPPPPV